MLSTLSSWKEKALDYFRTPAWKTVWEKKELQNEILKYLNLNDIGKCRLVCKAMNEIMLQVLEESNKYCFIIDSQVEENSAKKGFKIRSKMIRLRNIHKIDEIEMWLKRVDISSIRDVEMVDCIIIWTDVLRLIYIFQNMETLNIIARNDEFSSLYSESEVEQKDTKLKDEQRFKLLREMEEVISQGLPLDILKQNKRKLRKFTHDSQFVHYSSILLKILPIKYEAIEEFRLYIGSSDKTQKEYRSVSHLFASLSNCLVKNNLSLKKLLINTYVSSNDIERNQRIFFNEFTRSIMPILNNPLKSLKSVKDVSLSFANPNFEIDDSRNKFKRFISSLPSLKNIHIGPIQMKANSEILILSIVPDYVNCHFDGIYMFQQAPRSLVLNNYSYSDISFTISRLGPSLEMAQQTYNFKNYLPKNINFEKTMIHYMLPIMTKLHIDQNPKIIQGNLRFSIQDKEMQLIISKGTFITSLCLQCNLSLLTDSGLTGLKQEICKDILDLFKLNNDQAVQTLTHQKSLQSSKAGLGASLSSMKKLEHLALFNLGEGVTDATAFIAICGIQKLKSIIVNSPKLTELGMQAIIKSHPGTYVQHSMILN